MESIQYLKLKHTFALTSDQKGILFVFSYLKQNYPLRHQRGKIIIVQVDFSVLKNKLFENYFL